VRAWTGRGGRRRCPREKPRPARALGAGAAGTEALRRAAASACDQFALWVNKAVTDARSCPSSLAFFTAPNKASFFHLKATLFLAYINIVDTLLYKGGEEEEDHCSRPSQLIIAESVWSVRFCAVPRRMGALFHPAEQGTQPKFPFWWSMHT
jgi:hypothetical protein